MHGLAVCCLLTGLRAIPQSSGTLCRLTRSHGTQLGNRRANGTFDGLPCSHARDCEHLH